MTDTERERRRIVSLIAVRRDQAIRDYGLDPHWRGLSEEPK